MTDPKFKNVNGAYLTKQLFLENEMGERLLAVYTLKGYDHTFRGKSYPSLRRLFVETGDPTEYSFALKYLDGWEHWKAICAQGWFAPYLAEWREDLEVSLKSRALARIQQKALKQDKDALQADKILLTGGWKDPSEKSTVGRPTKARIKEEAQKIFKEKSVYDDDFNRILSGTPN